MKVYVYSGDSCYSGICLSWRCSGCKFRSGSDSVECVEHSVDRWLTPEWEMLMSPEDPREE